MAPSAIRHSSSPLVQALALALLQFSHSLAPAPASEVASAPSFLPIIGICRERGYFFVFAAPPPSAQPLSVALDACKPLITVSCR